MKDEVQQQPDSLETLWRGRFGDAYHERSPGNVAANIAFFSRIFGRTGGVESVIELGCGVGSNLEAIAQLLPLCERYGVEINEGAAESAGKWGEITCCSLLDYVPMRRWEFAFTKGVLIHLAPDDLPLAYAQLLRCSSRYILVAEYFAPHPRMVPYRGHDNALWARDFGGDMLGRYPELRLADYGFVSKRDPFPQDDLSWWLMEKRQ